MSKTIGVESEIRGAASEKGFDLTIPRNAFLLAKNTPQGWLLEGFPDLGPAFEKADCLAREGNTEVYVAHSRHGGVRGFSRAGQFNW